MALGEQFFYINNRIIDVRGLAVASQVFFYLTGTTTLQPVYANQDLSTPLANPLTVNAGAAIPNVWLDPSIIYRVRIIAATGEVIDDLDPFDALNAASLLFIQSGTGATARTAQAKMRERLSINDFTGADPSGVGDSTVAIQRAITVAQATGQPINVDGTYRHTAQIAVPARVRFTGGGATSDSGTPGVSCFLKDYNSGTAAGFLFDGDDSGAERIHFDSATGRTGDGVQLKGSRTFLDWCAVTSAGRDNIRVGSDDLGSNTNLWRLTFPISVDAGRHGLLVSDVTPPTDANGGLLNGCDIRDCAGDGINVDSGNWNTFIGPVCQGNGKLGFRFTANARGGNVIGGDIEGNLDDGAGSPRQAVIENGALAISVDAGLYSVGPWIDEGPASLNRIKQWDAGITRMVDGDTLSLVNPRAGGSASTELFAGPGKANVAAMRASVAGTSGGLLEEYTKQDGDVIKKARSVDQRQRTTFYAAVSVQAITVVYSASMTFDVSTGGVAVVPVTNATAFTINAPTNPLPGMLLEVQIKNTTGGAIGTATWNAVFKMAAWVQPTTGKSITITFRYDGTNWVERSRSAEVPN